MNKTEYLKSLKEALKDTDKSVMEEILSDYEEHFQVGMEKGKSEEQICEDLGSIDDLVEEIKEVYKTNSKESKKDDNETGSKNKKFKDWDFDFSSIDGKTIGNVINSALDTAGEAISNIDVVEIGSNIKTTLDQAASSLNNFADSYLKNQGTGPFDFDKRNAKGYTENVSKSYDDSEHSDEESENSEDESDSNSESSENIENTETNTETLNLAINGLCADINVAKSSNGKINISYVNNGNERQKQMYEFYSYKDKDIVYAGIRRVGKTVFLYNIKNSMNINVELPENIGSLNVKTANGGIKIEDVKLDRIVADSASGHVSTNRVYTTDYRIKCSSGDICMNEVNSIQVSASTMSGNVEADNIEAKNISLKSLSGDVNARNLDADIINNSSLSGDLSVAHMKASECKIRTTSGDIDINDFTMNNADISSGSGDIKLSEIIGDGLRACSISGDVKIDINVKRCHASSKSGNINVKCNGDLVLESSSISGNVNVQLKNYENGYCIKSRTTTGELYINYNNVRQRNLKTGVYSHGNQGSELILGTVSGDIHVND